MEPIRSRAIPPRYRSPTKRDILTSACSPPGRGTASSSSPPSTGPRLALAWTPGSSPPGRNAHRTTARRRARREGAGELHALTNLRLSDRFARVQFAALAQPAPDGNRAAVTTSPRARWPGRRRGSSWDRLLVRPQVRGPAQGSAQGPREAEGASPDDHHRSGGRSVAAVIAELRSYLNGWKVNFRLARTPGVLAERDSRIGRKLRVLQLKQWKRGTTAYRKPRSSAPGRTWPPVRPRTSGDGGGPAACRSTRSSTLASTTSRACRGFRAEPQPTEPPDADPHIRWCGRGMTGRTPHHPVCRSSRMDANLSEP
jgi:hypothetical protein